MQHVSQKPFVLSLFISFMIALMFLLTLLLLSLPFFPSDCLLLLRSLSPSPLCYRSLLTSDEFIASPRDSPPTHNSF